MTEELPLPTGGLEQDRLVAEFRQALQDTLFTCRLRVSPHRTAQLAQELASSFLHFLESGVDGVVGPYGEHLGQEGLSPQAILAVAEALRRACWEPARVNPQLLSLSGRYADALVEGYIHAREALVLQQQEQVHRAFMRAWEQQNGGASG